MDAPDSTCGVITPLRTIIDESWLPLLFRNIFIPYTRWRCLDHFSFRQPMESVYSFLLALHLLNKTCKSRCSLWGVKSCSVQVSVFFSKSYIDFFSQKYIAITVESFKLFYHFFNNKIQIFFLSTFTTHVYTEYVFTRASTLWLGDKRLMYNYHFSLKNKCSFEVI